MKTILLFSILLISSALYSQDNSIYKTWIGSKNEYFKITPDHIYSDFYFYNNFFSNVRQTNYRLNQDSLIVDMSTSYPDYHAENHSFRIVKLTSDSLILKPLSYGAETQYQKCNVIRLADSAVLYEKYLRFERLYFSATPCFGTCPGLKLEIDSCGNMFFYGYLYTGKYKGLYSGRLNQEEFNKLLEILKHSSLDNFPTGRGNVIDAPSYYFAFYYNGKKKSGEQSDVPFFNRKLFYFLMECYKNTELKKIKQTFNIPNLVNSKIKLPAGEYETMKGTPFCKMKILNDSLLVIDSASNFYFNETGKASYHITDNSLDFDFSENYVRVSDLNKVQDENIMLKFYVFDNLDSEPLPFVNISFINQAGDTIILNTDYEGNANLTLNKSSSPILINTSFVGYNHIIFSIIPDHSKQILIKLFMDTQPQYKIKKVSRKRLILKSRDNVTLILKKTD